MEKSTEAKVINGVIKLTDWQKTQNVYRGLARLSNTPKWPAIPLNQSDINTIKNDLIHISQIIATEHPHFSKELFFLKDYLFIGYGCLDPQVYGQIIAIFKSLLNEGDNPSQNNDRVKKLYKKINPTASKIPDGDAAMTSVFSANNPLLKVCDISTESGQNEQKGLMFMLQGAMSALRNPKAHANITLTAEDAMRRIMFASMLMYKIDEAVKYSSVQE